MSVTRRAASSPSVLGILLQIMDAGRLCDASGREVDFRNTLIVMTSNVGASAIAEGKGPIGFSAESGDRGTEECVRAELRAVFRAEFLNRIDEIVRFRPLAEEDLRAICRLLLKETAGRFEKLGVTLRVSDAAVERLASEGGGKDGARPLRRAVQRLIADPAAELLLAGEAGAGDELFCDGRRGHRPAPRMKNFLRFA